VFVADANETTLTTPTAAEGVPMTQRLDYQKLSTPSLRALGGVYTYIVNSGLPKALIDLVFLRASQINGCAYCIDMHSRDLLKGGVAVEKMMLVSAWREAGDIFTDKEKAALQ
jgi:AhpD family alkylhydroperoxidase